MMKPLSVMPYYGGKSAMSEYINSILDYDNTDTFVTPFGGAARCLLNKPRHRREIYIEINPGLSKLFEVLSNRESGMALINKICDETEYSQDCFDRYLHIKNEYENNIPRMVVEEFVRGLCAVNEASNKVKGKRNRDDKTRNLSSNIIRRRFYEAFDKMIQYSVGGVTKDGKITDAEGYIPYIQASSILGRKLTKDEEKIISQLETNMDLCTKAYYYSIHKGERLESLSEEKTTLDFVKRIKDIAEQADQVTKEAKIPLDEWYAKLMEKYPEHERLFEFAETAAIQARLNGISTNEMIERIVKINRFKPYTARYDVYKDSYSMVEIYKFLKLQTQFLNDIQTQYDLTIEDITAEGIDEILNRIGKDNPFNETHNKISRAVNGYINNLYREHFYNNVYVARDNSDVSDLTIALATYVIFTQSRNAMGKEWAEGRYKNSSDYHRRVKDVQKGIDRLEDVEVYCGDAYMYIREDQYDYFNDERAMVYCDPPYLKDKDVEHQNEDKTLMEYNPGLVYKNGWIYADHI